MSRPKKSASNKLPRKSFASKPVHNRIADLCRDAIHKGTFAPGERFPSERELADSYDVSRATANKVISSLIAEGLLDLQKGIGTFVRKGRPLFASLDGMESFTSHARQQGHEPATQVLTFKHVSCSSLPKEVRMGLGLEEGVIEPVIYLERLRLADGIPMIVEFRWVRESLALGLEKEDVKESFYRVLEEKFDVRMTGERHTISAVLMDETASELFQVSEPCAALQVEGTGFVKGETPLWYQRLLYRGDRYQLNNQSNGLSASAVELRLQDQRRPA